MPNTQKVILAIDSLLSGSQLRLVSDLDFIKESDVTFVHIVQDLDYGDGVSFNVSFPDELDMSKLTHAVVEKMKSLSSEILPPGHTGKVRYECLFAGHTGDTFCRYLQKEKADLAILASYERHHIFDISFSDYVSKHASCNVLILKRRCSKKMKVIVSLKLDENEEFASELSRINFLKAADLVLLHISKYSEYGQFSGTNLVPFTLEEEKLIVEQEILNRLGLIKKKLFESGFTGDVETLCEFSNHPKKHFVHYVNKTLSDFVLVFQSKRKNIRGSFIQHILHHSNVSAMVVKLSHEHQSIKHFHPAYLNKLKGNPYIDEQL